MKSHQAPKDFTAVTPSGRRLGFLDVLRGLAALSVCLQHYFEVSPAYSARSMRGFNLGIFGVTVFFLVSGFIIPASIEKHADIRNFWRGRFFRLYPMYFLVLLVMLLSDLIHHQNPLPGSAHATLGTLLNFTLFQQFFGFPNVIALTWTLSLEIIFYVLCSIAFVRGWLEYPVRLAGFAIGALFLADITAGILHRSLPVGRIGLVILSFFGTLIYRAYKNQASYRSVLMTGSFLILVLLHGFWLRFHIYRELNAFGQPFETFTCVSLSWMCAIAFFALVYCLRHLNFPAPLQWLGKVSYSFYLLGGVVPSLAWIVLAGWHALAMKIILPLLLSAATYRWIERPFMRLGTPASPKTSQT